MPLDAQADAFLKQVAAMEAPPISEQSPEEARAVGLLLGSLSVPEEVAAVEDRDIPGPTGDITVRVYRPPLETAVSDGPLPTLVWYHGGGVVVGDLDTTDGVCRALCRRSGLGVISVGYRLAPEDPYPAALDDAVAACDYVRHNAAEFDAVPDRLAVGGDSAGGNLAAVVANHRRSEVAFQLLVYPVTDMKHETESFSSNAEGYFLTVEHALWFENHYRAGADPTDPRISPAYESDLSGVAPAFVMTAEFDPLRDEGEAYAAKLKDAGVPVALTRYDGTIHAFIQMSSIFDVTRKALDDAASALTDALT